MTKEQEELLRLTRPTRFRSVKKASMYIKDRIGVLKLKMREKWLEFRYTHEVREEETLGALKLLPVGFSKKNIVANDNVAFDLSIRKQERTVTYSDRFLKKKNGDIYLDRSRVKTSFIYTAVPVDIKFRVDKSEPYKRVDDYLDNLVFRVPSGEKNGITVYEDYRFNPQAIMRLNYHREFEEELSEEEERNFLEVVREVYESQMERDFKMSQCLVRVKGNEKSRESLFERGNQTRHKELRGSV